MNKKIRDIGCGKYKVSQDAIGLDIVKLSGVDIVHEINVKLKKL